MKYKEHNASIQMIKIEQINILNPRVRNQKIFDEITENISKVGLKRPITITKSKSGIAGKEYDLVCGQGRIEAFQACGQSHIPAIVIDASEEDALIMSLVENLARKSHRSIDLLRGIQTLQQKGYDYKVIAKKTGISVSYAYSIVDLFERGEERLLVAVDSGNLPIDVAFAIVNSPNEEQKALQDAYENNQLRGKKLKMAKKLLEFRNQYGKKLRPDIRISGLSKNRGEISSQDVLRVYQKEVDRKRLLTKKADIASNRLLFIVEGLRHLLEEDNFTTLLKAEGLVTLPKPIANLLEKKS